jgi:hypothetical protein
MYWRLGNPTRVDGLKTSGHIQKGRDFFGPGIAEVPTTFYAKWGLEFGARV